MQSFKKFEVMFPVRMSAELKRDGQAAADLAGMNFSQFVRQAIQRNINVAMEIDREVSKRLLHSVMSEQ